MCVVENVRQGDPARFTLKMLGVERLRRLLEHAAAASDYRTSIYADYGPDPSQGAFYAANAFGSLAQPDQGERLFSCKSRPSAPERTIA